MNPALFILNRLTVLYAARIEQGWRYTVMEAYRAKGEIRLMKKSDDFSLDRWKGRKQKYPVVVALCGRGIVSKEYPSGAEAIRRITAHPEEFLFGVEKCGQGRERLTFLRRDQYNELMAELSVYKLPIITTRIDPVGDPEAEARATAVDFFGETLAGKNMLKPLPENNTLFGLITGRLLLPVLGVVLLALMVNFFIQQNLQQQAEEQQFILNGFSRTTTQRSQEQDRQQELQEMLVTGLPYPYAWVADRIASVIPPGVTLTELTIQPILKKLQENKPLTIETNRVVIRGQAASAIPITCLTDTLRSWETSHSVQLLSLTRDRNNHYQFEIDLRL